MSKLTLTNLANLQNENTAVAAINANNVTISSFADNTLSRNGATPNSMSAELDMNSNRIINLPDSVAASSPIRKDEFDSAIAALSAVGHGDMFAANHLSEMVGHETAAQANLGLTTPLARLALMREVLTTDRTYYVRTDGNNSNDGLTNTSGGAKLTIQGAWNAAIDIDCNNHNVTIQVADGTYTTPTIIGSPLLNVATCTITGNTTTPTNCVLSCTTGDCVFIEAVPHPIRFAGFFVTTPSGGSCCFNLRNHATVYFTGNMNFGFCDSSHVQVDNSNAVYFANYTISGNTVGSHHHIIGFGTLGADGITVTISGSVGWGSYYVGIGAGFASYTGATFVGSALSGQKYFVHLNGAMKLAGVVLPGTIAGESQGGNVDDECNQIIINHATQPNLKFKVNAVEKASMYGTTTAVNVASNSALSNGVFMTYSTNGWNNFSDRRAKTDVETLDALGLLEDYRAVRYKDKHDGKDQIGVIAQEQVNIFPEFVAVGSGEEDEDISFASENKWGVRYDQYGPVALQGVKQLYEIIKDLQDEIKELKKNV